MLTVWEENANEFDLCAIKTFLSSAEASRKQINTSLPPQEADQRGGVATCSLAIIDEVKGPTPLTRSRLDVRLEADDAFLGGSQV